jgi:cell division protein FtsZ
VKGLVNLDFADVRSIMENSGQAMIGFGTSCGANRGVEAIEQAISHPLLEDLSLSGAQGALVNITSDSSITMEEMSKAMDRIYEEVGENADIFWGQTINESLEDAIQVTLIVTGIKATMA